MLTGVDCNDSASCLAVGYYVHPGNFWTAMAEGWNGSAWAALSPPEPSGAQFWSFTSVSCAGTTCMAVGSSATTTDPGTSNRLLTETYSDGVWTVRKAAPAPQGNGRFTAVSCATPTACTAVGSQGAGYPYQPIAERWDGTTWTVQELDEPPDFLSVQLNGLSCPSAAYCAAVGSAVTSVDEAPIFEQWSGGTWSARIAPEHTGPVNTYLSAVDCVSATACQLVGYDTTGSGFLAESWHGGTLAIEDVSTPSGWTQGELLGVDCVTATSCRAVGGATATTNFAAVAAVLGAGSWSIQTVDGAGSAVPGALQGVTCASATSCEAVGYEAPPYSGTHTLAEGLTAAGWEQQPTPQPSPRFPTRLLSVSCAASDDCGALGTVVRNSYSTPVEELWNGAAWRLAYVATPSAARSSLVYNAISCAPPLACVAVGSFVNQRHYQWPGAATGTSATSPSLPSGGRSGQLSDVSCAADVSFCMTVGSWTDADGLTHPLTYTTHNATGWQLKSAADPGMSSELTAVSCRTTQFCLAVGSDDPGTGAQSFAETWNGSAWALAALPAPAGSFDVLHDVSCASTTSCIAVGVTDSGNGVLLYHWDGSAWQRVDVTLPAGATTPDVTAVSCPAATCEAVGSVLTNGGTRPLALRGTASTWTGTTAPRPTGATFAQFTGVSCVTATDCTAVGTAHGSDGIDATLVAQLN